VIEAAFESFVERGYQGTTMAGVAKRAGVSEQTMYFTFGSKAALLQDVMVAKRGAPDEPTAVMERAWVSDVLSEPDQRRALALVVEYATEIFRRLAPIADAMTAAVSTDEAFAADMDTISAQRREGIGRIVNELDAKKPLAIPVTRATDVLDVVQSMSTYNAFVRGCGWSNEEYKAWAYRTLTQLLTAVSPAKQRTLDASATRGLTYHDEVQALEPVMTEATGRRTKR
jgi:AcrR family transcriptional regulator